MKIKILIVDKEKDAAVNGVSCKSKREARDLAAKIEKDIDTEVYAVRVVEGVGV